MALEPGIFRLLEDRHEWQKSADRKLDPVLRELAIIRAGWARGSQFVFSQHCKVIRALGVPEEKIAAIAAWQTTDVFTELERLVLAYADDLVLGSGRVTDARFDALKAQRVQARNMTIAVDPGGWSATVKLTWVVETVPKVGSPRRTQMPATLRMLKVATGEWFIVSRR